ncbi:MAG: cobalt ECF transporter T component CbiQ [Planctomycetota bacterium]
MEYHLIDAYSKRDNFLHRLDPRTKIILFIGFVILIVLTPPKQFVTFGQYGLLIIGLILLSRIPAWFYISRALLVLPFVLMIVIFVPFLKEGQTAFQIDLWFTQARVTYEGLMVCWNVLAKSVSSVLLMTLLIATTPFNDILHGLAHLRVPRILITLVSFMYRYLFVLLDETERMQHARISRWFGGYVWRQIKVIGNMIGLLFIRSYERSERIYASMLARGFDGHIRRIDNHKFRIADAIFVLIVVFLLLLIVTMN